jgi:hypothetical protein
MPRSTTAKSRDVGNRERQESVEVGTGTRVDDDDGDIHIVEYLARESQKLLSWNIESTRG